MLYSPLRNRDPNLYSLDIKLLYSVCVCSHVFLSLLSLFKKSGLMRSLCFLCVCESSLSIFLIPESIIMKLGMFIIASDPISTAYFINPSHPSVCLYVYPLIIAGQRPGKNVTAVTLTHATIEDLLNASLLRDPRFIKG
jgi:hypothetical protein